MPRPTVVIIGMVLILTGSLAQAATSELKLASDVWPPFTDQPGKPRVAIRLVQEALLRADCTTDIKILDFEAVIQGLGMGNHDGSAALWKDPERENYLLFSEPYLENRLILVGPSGADVSAADLSALKGKKLAVVAGYSYGDLTEPGSGPVLVEGANDKENLIKVLDGEVDYMLVDELLMSYLISNQAEEAQKHLAIGTTALVRRPLHFALLKGLPGAETIIAKFNEAIVAMVADGTFNTILGLNWIRADVDGDGQMELVYGGDGAGPDAPGTGYAVNGMAADDTSSSVDRFWIEGEMYEGWEDVPEKYKYSGPGEVKEDPGMTLFQMDF